MSNLKRATTFCFISLSTSLATEKKPRQCSSLAFWPIIVWLIAHMTLGSWPALAAPPRSILVLDQSERRGPLYYEIFSAFRSAVNATLGPPVSIYWESLDLSRFGGSAYEEGLQAYLQVKYQERPIGVVVAIGDAALEAVLRWRTRLWPGVPIVFSMIEETTLARLRPLPDMTGSIMKLTLADAITSARAVVPDLKTIVFVGDAWESQTVFNHWKEEIPVAAVGLEIVDLTGTQMGELRKRVAALPDHSAILYTSIYSDGEGTFYPPADALTFFADAANRPIIVSAETFIGRGGIGGFVIAPSAIGKEAAQFSLRILDGESIANMPAGGGSILHPIFDWRQLRRWGISEASLPSGSEIRFRDPSIWDQYHVHILVAIAAFLGQSALICWLFYEHRRRHLAEIKSRNAMSELTYMNRQASAGQLSASLAHEINQPLTGIATRASAARRWLRAERPDLEKAGAALDQIEAATHRASDIVTSVRAMFKKETGKKLPVDINGIILTVLAIVRIDLQKNGVEVQTQLDQRVLIVEGDKVQLQQVVLNLVMNAIEAMQPARHRVLKVKSEQRKLGLVHVSIEDTGTGIDPSNLDRIFSALFTTKERGMGMGLSICHSIIESHNGRIWVTPHIPRGSIFQFELPTADKDGTMAA